MRRLLYGVILIAILSQIPQVSDQFKDEKQGINAAYGKAVRVYNLAADVYGKTKNDFEVIQARLDQTKKVIDSGIAGTQKASDEASRYLDSVKLLNDGAGKGKEEPAKK